MPAVAAPVAAYVPAVRVGDLVYTSGQLPFVDGELLAAGKVREISAAGQSDSQGSVSPEQARDAARIAALNALAAVDDLVGIDAVERIIKVTGFVAPPRFNGQPGVITARPSSSARFRRRRPACPSPPSASTSALTPRRVEIIVQVRS